MASAAEKITQVEVTKVAVWKVNGTLFEDVKTATKETRRLVIEELATESGYEFADDGSDIAFWVADNWDRIEARVERAMAGT